MELKAEMGKGFRETESLKVELKAEMGQGFREMQDLFKGQQQLFDEKELDLKQHVHESERRLFQDVAALTREVQGQSKAA